MEKKHDAHQACACKHEEKEHERGYGCCGHEEKEHKHASGCGCGCGHDHGHEGGVTPQIIRIAASAVLLVAAWLLPLEGFWRLAAFVVPYLLAGYGVLRAYSGTEAVLLLDRCRPDLVLLDLMLPGMSGEAVLPRIRNVPVIALSAKADVQDKVRLLLGGAVDYITKPFDTEELLARIQVQLRRAGAAEDAEVLRTGDLQLDTATHAVRVNDGVVHLTRTEYAILKLLMRNPGQVVARSMILDRICADTPDCTENSLRQHISNLRRKLREAGGREYIEAVWGIGFRLIPGERMES